MQAVLTDIRVLGHELRLSLEGLGSFVASDYLHTFPLRRLPSDRVPYVRGELLDKEILRSLARRNIHPTVRKVQFFDPESQTLQPRNVKPLYDMIQLDAPLELAQSRCFPLGQLQQHCLQHPRLQGLERAIEKLFRYVVQHPPDSRPPYTIDTVRQHLFAHPNINDRHKSTINHILAVLEAGWPIEGEADNTPKVRIPSPIPVEFHRGEYTSLARWRIAPRGSVVDIDDSLVQEIKSGQTHLPLRGRIKYLRARTAEELRDETISFFDIEMPLFETEEAEVSWVASMALTRGVRFSKVIQTLYDSPGMVNGYALERCASSADLVTKVRDTLRHAEARTVAVYNAPFDTIRLREAGEFTVGDDETEPKKIATLPFFERIGIKGKDVLDLLRWARIYCDYLPNKKLVMVGKHLLGETSFAKEINYDQQAELERICQGSDPASASPPVRALLEHRTAAEILASYVGHDVSVLADLVESGQFQESVDDVAHLAQIFHIDPFLLLHDAKRIQDFLERKLYEQVGTFRDVVHPRFKVFVRYEQRVKEKLKRVILSQFPDDASGIIENVTKAYLPLGEVLRPHLVRFFPELREFYEYSNAHRSNARRHFFLAQYESALAEWMWQDYASFLYERRKWETMSERLPPQRFHAWALDIVARGSKSGLEDKIKKGVVSQRDLRLVLNEGDHSFLEDLGLNLSSVRDLFAQWCLVQQKNRILWGAYGQGWESFDQVLRGFCTRIQDYLSANGLEVVHAQNRYLYVQGNAEALYSTSSPLIPVLHIPRTYRAGDKIYYPLHGFMESFKRDSRSTHYLNIFEMRTFGGFLDLVLAGDEDSALARLRSGLQELTDQRVPLADLVWHTASTGKYHAFEDGEEIHFYNWRPEETCRVKILKGIEYPLERQKGKPHDFIEEPYLEEGEMVFKRRVLSTPGDIHPDWEMYTQKALERARELAKPLLEKGERL